MTNLDSIFDNTLSTKVHLVKAMVFPIVMYGCESWTIKKAECWRIDAFELWCWRRPLRVPWTARRSNQSMLKEISPGCSLEGMMLKLKLQYFGQLMRRVDSLGKTMIMEGIGGQEEKGTTEDEMAGWHHRLDGREFEWTPGDGDGQGGLACCDSWGRRVGHDWTTELNWTELCCPVGGAIAQVFGFSYLSCIIWQSALFRPIPHLSRFLGGSVVQNPSAYAGDMSLIPELGNLWRRKRQPTPEFLSFCFPGSTSSMCSIYPP